MRKVSGGLRAPVHAQPSQAKSLQGARKNARSLSVSLMASLTCTPRVSPPPHTRHTPWRSMTAPRPESGDPAAAWMIWVGVAGVIKMARHGLTGEVQPAKLTRC